MSRWIFLSMLIGTTCTRSTPEERARLCAKWAEQDAAAKALPLPVFAKRLEVLREYEDADYVQDIEHDICYLRKPSCFYGGHSGQCVTTYTHVPCEPLQKTSGTSNAPQPSDIPRP